MSNKRDFEIENGKIIKREIAERVHLKIYKLQNPNFEINIGYKDGASDKGRLIKVLKKYHEAIDLPLIIEFETATETKIIDLETVARVWY